MRSSVTRAKVSIVIASGKLQQVRVDAPIESAEKLTEMAVRVAQRLESSAALAPMSKGGKVEEVR
jgi:hypothetical protein